MGSPFDKIINSNFGKTATFLEKGMDMIKPIDHLTGQEKRSAQVDRTNAVLLGSAALNLLPKIIRMGMKEGGMAKQRMKLMPVPFLDEPVYMNLGGVATKSQMAHNNQLMKLGGDVKGKLDKIALKKDTIPALLQVGEIVIPRRISTTKKFKDHLKKNYKYDSKRGKFIQ